MTHMDLMDERAELIRENNRLRAALLAIERAADDHHATSNDPWGVIERVLILARAAVRK